MNTLAQSVNALTKSEWWRVQRDARRRDGWAAANKAPLRPKAPRYRKPGGGIPTDGTMKYLIQNNHATYVVHPVRQIEKFFHELSPRGMEIALRLKFGGQGRAGMMSRPELMARIADLQRFVGVKQYG